MVRRSFALRKLEKKTGFHEATHGKTSNSTFVQVSSVHVLNLVSYCGIKLSWPNPISHF